MHLFKQIYVFNRTYSTFCSVFACCLRGQWLVNRHLVFYLIQLQVSQMCFSSWMYGLLLFWFVKVLVFPVLTTNWNYNKIIILIFDNFNSIQGRYYCYCMNLSDVQVKKYTFCEIMNFKSLSQKKNMFPFLSKSLACVPWPRFRYLRPLRLGIRFRSASGEKRMGLG